MANSNGTTPAPTTIYLNISSRVQRLCRDHALWANGQPRGALATVLTGAVPWPKDLRTGGIIYECSRPQADAMLALVNTLHNAMRQAGCGQKDGATAAQWRRRIVESIHKARPPLLFGAPAAPAGVDLFGATPAGAKALDMYQRHVMKSLRDLVDFSQSSAY
jgi:hypothetical protein